MAINYMIYILLGLVAVLTLIKVLLDKPKPGESSRKRWIWIISMLTSLLLLVVTLLKPPITSGNKIAGLEDKIDRLTELIDQMVNSDSIPDNVKEEADSLSREIRNSGLSYSSRDSALVAIGLRDYRDAMKSLDRIVRDPQLDSTEKGQAFLLQSYTQTLAGHPQRAKEAIDSAAVFLPDDSQVNLMIGRNYELDGKLVQAEMYYNIAAMQDSGNPVANENLSRINKKIQDFSTATFPTDSITPHIRPDAVNP